MNWRKRSNYSSNSSSLLVIPIIVYVVKIVNIVTDTLIFQLVLNVAICGSGKLTVLILTKGLPVRCVKETIVGNVLQNMHAKFVTKSTIKS